MTSATTSEEPRKVKGSHKLLAGIALTLGVVMALTLLFSHQGLYQIYRFRSERLKLEQENARLEAENARLAHTIDRLHHDPEMIQDLIRRELNFVKKNEIIFQLPPGGPDKPAPSPATSTVAPPAAASPNTGAQSHTGKERFAWEALQGAPKKAVPGSALR
jgi:cell division protein FtsB